MKEDLNFPTIRQAAKRGPLSERSLRLLQKQGRLPGFFIGKTFRVNFPAFLDQLQKESLNCNLKLVTGEGDRGEGQEFTAGITQRKERR